MGSGLLSFPSDVQALSEAFAVQAARYPWYHVRPANGMYFFAQGSIEAPANSTQTEVLEYTVPDGFHGVITHLVLAFEAGAGAALVPGDGSVTWAIDVNRKAGSISITGRSLRNWEAILFPLGTYQNPWPVPDGQELNSGEVLRVKVTTANPAPVGSPARANAIVQGWVAPVRG